MYLVIVVTSLWINAFCYDSKARKIKTYNIPLLFPAFRKFDSHICIEVINKVKAYFDVSDSNLKELVLLTENDTLDAEKVNAKIYKISEVLNNIKLPILYVGEAKGFFSNIIYPLVINPSDFYRWFNLAENINDVENYFYNRRGYGAQLPSNNWEQAYETALFREKLTFLLDNVPKNKLIEASDVILTGEGLINAGTYKHIVLSFLDSNVTPGFFRLHCEKGNSLLSIESLRILDSKIAEDASNSFLIRDLAGCLIYPGAQEISLKFPSGEEVKSKLKPNDLAIIPLNKNSIADLKVIKNSEAQYYKVSGGEYGLVVDNRTRPLLKNINQKDRIITIENWLSNLSSVLSFDPSDIPNMQNTKAFEDASNSTNLNSENDENTGTK